jgi:hypothetical protein
MITDARMMLVTKSGTRVIGFQANMALIGGAKDRATRMPGGG